MKIGVLLAVLFFSAGATFTLLDIGTDCALAFQYWNQSYILRPNINPHEETTNWLLPEDNDVFAMLTTTWVVLGGVAQAIIVHRFWKRHDRRLDILPKSIQIALLISTAFLLGPVVVDIYGAYYVLKNSNDERIQVSIDRYNKTGELWRGVII